MKFIPITVDGINYRCDKGKQKYGNGGYEINVRPLGELPAFKANGYPTHIVGKVTRFFVDKKGIPRWPDPKKSKLWPKDTPREEWLPYYQFAKAYFEAVAKSNKAKLEKRKNAKRITVRRNNRLMSIERSNARPSEIEAWERGDKI
jgi:hypothetical protein